MRRDDTVVCLGEDIGAAEGVFKTVAGLFTYLTLGSPTIRSSYDDARA